MSRFPVEAADDLHHYYHMNPPQHFHPQLYDVAQHAPHGEASLTTYTDHWQTQHYQRKRPKYTRSKTGCLTCRRKKVKCDEEKPDCARCRAGNRECVWPDSSTSQRRNTRREVRPAHSPSADLRPSTAGSSGPSEASHSPAQHFTLPKAEPVELLLPPSALSRGDSSTHGIADGSISRAAFSDHRRAGSSMQFGGHGGMLEDEDRRAAQHYPPAAFQSVLHAPQYFACQYETQHHPQISQSPEHWQASASFSDAQPARSQYLETRRDLQTVKTEYDEEEWQAMLSQHVDPLNPFVHSATHNYYPIPQGNALLEQDSRQMELSYPYMKMP